MITCSRCGINCKKIIRIEVGYSVDGSGIYYLCKECKEELDEFFEGENLCKCKTKENGIYYGLYHNGRFIRKKYTEKDGSQK